MNTTAMDKPKSQVPFESTKLASQWTSFNLMDSSACNHLYRLAELFSKSDMIPAQFQGKPANVFVVLQIAIRCGLDPFGVLQKSYVIGGRPAFETQLAIAMLNSSGKIRGPVRYHHDGKGKDRSCTAIVIDAATGEVIKHTLHWATVELNNWHSKKGSSWATDPLLMMKYRAAYQLIRTTYPDVLLGMISVEEAAELKQSDPMTLDSAEMYRESLDAKEIADELVARMDQQAETPELSPAQMSDDQFALGTES